jgi:hypothetical protein
MIQENLPPAIFCTSVQSLVPRPWICAASLRLPRREPFYSVMNLPEEYWAREQLASVETILDQHARRAIEQAMNLFAEYWAREQLASVETILDQHAR